MQQGIPGDRIHVLPFILNPGFTIEGADLRAARTRASLGFRTDQKVVLLLGGGDGMPRGYRITRRILSELPDAGVILICGKNQALLRRAGILVARPGGERLRVYGFVENVPDLIAASDAVLTKGGASTVMEILALGKTPVITTYIWEQEKGNVEFVVDNQLGVYERRIGALPAAVKGIFDDAPPYRRIRESIHRRKLTSGTPEAAQLICSSFT